MPLLLAGGSSTAGDRDARLASSFRLGCVRQRGGNWVSVSSGHTSCRYGGNGVGHGVARRVDDLGHHLGLHVAVLGLPLVVGLQQHGTDQADDRSFVGEDPHELGPAFDLLVQPLDRVRAVQLGSVLDGEVHVRQHVGLTVVDERPKLRPLRPELVGDMPQGLARSSPVRLDERLTECSRRHALLGFRDGGQGVAHPMHPGAVEKACRL